LLNVALWWYTKKEWSEANPKLAKEWKNPRDYASINELIVMSRLETLNHEMIKKWLQKKDRFDYLKEISKDMLEKLNKQDFIKSVKKLKNTTYTDIKKLK
jgi:acyl carrier protein phosphodiesterase